MTQDLELRYTPFFGAFMLICSVFILGVALLTGQLFPQIITGGILLLVSLGFLTRPIAVVTSGEIEMRNMLGMTLKTHPRAQLQVRDGKLFANDKVVLRSWLVRGADWAQLERLGA